MDMNSDEWIRSIIDKIKTLDYIDPDEIPNIDLYMDQVTTFMDKHLKSSKRYSDDKLLTKTMINNYTKNDLLPSPNRKKYSKEHILLLIFIYYFKNILTINDIQSIFGPLTEKYYGGETEIGLEEIYKAVFSNQKDQIETIIKDVIKKFNKSKDTFEGGEEDEDKEFLNVFSFICMLSFDVYVKKQMIEKIIDDYIVGNKVKNKENKEKESIKK
jgi:DNA-binding transcriptional MerR regulator